MVFPFIFFKIPIKIRVLGNTLIRFEKFYVNFPKYTTPIYS